MSNLKTLSPLALGVCLLAGSLAAQTNRVLVFPSGASSNVGVLDAATLAAVGTVPVSTRAFQALVAADGSKYYIFSNSVTDTITVVNAANLTVIRRIDLGTLPALATITPDGRRLLVAAGRLRIFDTATDTELPGGGLDVGQGPSEIEVTNDSSRAYVLSTPSGQISVIDLAANTVATRLTTSLPLAIAIRPDQSRLLVVSTGSMTIYRLPDHSVLTTVTLAPINFAKVSITPDGSKAAILNRGVAPFNISRIVDIASLAVTSISDIGFTQIVVADNSTAFGLVQDTNRVVKIDLNSGPSQGTATVQDYGVNTRAMEISPSGRTLYLASFASSNVTRVDVASNQAVPATVPIAPTGLALAFPPAAANASGIAINGGNEQFVNQGQTANIPLSVKITTSDGTPVFNAAVTFASAATGVTIAPAQPSRTNSRGIAQASVTVPAPAPATLEGETPAGQPLASEPGAGGDPGRVSQGIETVVVTASSPGAGVISFNIRVGLGTGVIIVSGNYQITRPNTAFPLPLVVRVTDDRGLPPPPGTQVCFNSLFSATLPPSTVVSSDTEGIAQAQFQGGTLPVNFVSFPPPGLPAVNVGVCDLALPIQGVAQFYLQTAVSVPTAPEVESGDGQTGDVGTTLPFPLAVRVRNSFGPVAQVGVTFRVLSGPAGASSASLNPSLAVTDFSGTARTTVTIGPRPGREPIVIEATVPGAFGSARFSLSATGGPPERVEILQGDNQSGNVGTALPLALRVRVTDLLGNRIPLPNQQYPLTYSVSPQSAATIVDNFQQQDGEASVRVILGTTPGPFQVIAVCGNGRAVFNLRLLPVATAIVLISGNNQRLPQAGTSADPLVVRTNDNQGNPVAGTEVTFRAASVVTFVPLQGQPGNPLVVRTDADGRAAARVRLLGPTPIDQLVLTAATTFGSVTFRVSISGRQPAFTAASIVNAGSFRPGMVPGSLATLFGAGLSEVTGLVTPGGALTAQGVTLTIAGRQAPLFAIANVAGNEQINFQVPAELVPGVPARVEVNNNGSITAVEGVAVLQAQPGIFEDVRQGTTTRYAAVVKLDGSVVGPNNPAVRGTFVLLFLTGLGPTTPSVGTGQAAPSIPPLATTTLDLAVGLNDAGVPNVTFSGLAPGFIGLHQINFQIPENAPVGTVRLDVVIGGAASNTSRIEIQ